MILQSDIIIDKPLVSVIILTFNQEQYIRQCIDSVLAQETEFHFEIIIGEDCGSDLTRAICIEYQERFPQKIKLLLNDTNVGVLVNWYNCIKESRGKYIAQCAGDDFWHNKKKLQLQTKFLERNSDFGIVHSDFDILYATNGRIEKDINKKSSKVIPVGYIMKELYDQYHLVAPTIQFKKQLFLEYIPIEDFILRGFLMEDLPTFIIMSNFCKTGYIEQSTATYRKGNFSISVQSDMKKVEEFYDSFIEIMKYLSNLFSVELEYRHSDLIIHKYSALLSNAYKFESYSHAKVAGEILKSYGMKNKKISFSRNYLFFKLYNLTKKLFYDN